MQGGEQVGGGEKEAEGKGSVRRELAAVGTESRLAERDMSRGGSSGKARERLLTAP
jgi:hypothetical protein